MAPRERVPLRLAHLALAFLLAPEPALAGDAGQWQKLELPGIRWFHAVAYDPAGQRMVMFGGDAPSGTLADVWQLALSPQYLWSRQAPTGTPPPPRFAFASIYDPSRNRIVIFGGVDASSTSLNDVWALTLSNPPVWTQLFPSGAPPAGRRFTAAAYDPVRDRMILHGGYASPTTFGDTWALSFASGPAWSRLSPSGVGPGPRSGQSALYDPVRDRLLLFAGNSGGGLANDVFALALGVTPHVWSLVGTTGLPPGPCRLASAIYDPGLDRMVVFGGYQSDYTNETWALSLGSNAWSQLLPPAPLPTPRVGHSAIYDPVHAAMLVFGGGNDALLQYDRDLWSLSLAGSPAWSQPVGVGTPPAPRYQHSAIDDPVRERMIVFGGTDLSGDLNDTWALPLTGEPAWAPLTTYGNPPSPRAGHTAIYDAANDRMIVYGGQSASVYFDEMWALSLADPPTWSPVSQGRVTPQARADHAAVYDPVGHRMIVTGGRSGGTYFNEVWAFSLSDGSGWSQLLPPSAPCLSPFAYHSMIRDPVRDQLILYGGDNYGWPACEPTWKLTTGPSPAWSSLVASGPPWRYDHTAVYEPTWDRMVVFGGAHASEGAGDPSRYFADVWELLPGTPQWNALLPAAYLPDAPRPDSTRGHVAILDPPRHRMIVFGGLRGVASPSLLDETWALQWTPGPVAVDPQGIAGAHGLQLAAGPNPFSDEGRIRFVLPAAARATLTVLDLAGRRVRTLLHESALPAGPHEVRWDGLAASGRSAADGVYFVRLQAGAQGATRRLVRVRSALP